MERYDDRRRRSPWVIAISSTSGPRTLRCTCRSRAGPAGEASRDYRAAAVGSKACDFAGYAHAVDDWCRFNGNSATFIDPGSPWQTRPGARELGKSITRCGISHRENDWARSWYDDAVLDRRASSCRLAVGGLRACTRLRRRGAIHRRGVCGVRFVTFRPGEPNASGRRCVQEMFSVGRYWFARVPGLVPDDHDSFALHDPVVDARSTVEVLNRHGRGG